MAELTLDQLRAIAPHAPEEALAALNAGMLTAEASTPLRQAAFLAQMAHESNQFRAGEEHWVPTPSQIGYENNLRLGNYAPGDGYRFRGRGFIQLTGRKNYSLASKALGVDLVTKPELAAQPGIAAQVAAWYWTTHKLNAKADEGDFAGITLAINGGMNGAKEREAFYTKALTVLVAVPVCG